jgi:hypothetical protein
MIYVIRGNRAAQAGATLHAAAIASASTAINLSEIISWSSGFTVDRRQPSILACARRLHADDFLARDHQTQLCSFGKSSASPGLPPDDEELRNR